MIKIACFTFFCLFCCSFFSWSQSSLPPVYELKPDTTLLQDIDSLYWQKLEDKSGKLTINDVLREPFIDKFHIKGSKAEGIDKIGVHTVWLRFRMKNIFPVNMSIALSAPVDEYDIYIIKNENSVKHYRTGLLRKWDEKDGLKSAEEAGAIPITIASGEELTVYNRQYKKNKHIQVSKVQLYSTEKLISKDYVDYVDRRQYYFASFHLQETFIIGMIFISIFISLFFYRVVKEKVYLYFALFAFFLGINRLYNISGSYARWFRPDLSPYVGYIGFAWTFIPFFLIQFIRYFFIVKDKYPRWDKFLLWAGLLNMFIGVSVMIVYISNRNAINELYEISSLISFVIIPLTVIITSLLYTRDKNYSFRFIAFGSIPLMLLYLISLLPQADNLFWNFIGRNFRLIEMVFLCWLLLCFVRVMIMRFDILRKENAQQALDKERLAREKETERNELIEKQKNELGMQVEERTADLKRSIEDLKATQKQLIQSEKMASLGELTAGIAHEIQNPLNFVNNFSEVNTELIDELVEEADKGNMSEVKLIANDIKDNEQKINHHGKRADAIVKGMLQHSRSSNGIKESTDINALCDEYLRLSYHGLRAKDKSFNATLKTDFDPSIGKINIIPQDIGRVIMNLLTNAFYAVTEKSKQGIQGYEPTVSVTTMRSVSAGEGRGEAIIKVTDNGNGIPQNIVDKIFQPFFTTKPTGQGTGLGLSLSYDIITKGHGGELQVETKEHTGTSFIIKLPLN